MVSLCRIQKRPQIKIRQMTRLIHHLFYMIKIFEKWGKRPLKTQQSSKRLINAIKKFFTIIFLNVWNHSSRIVIMGNIFHWDTAKEKQKNDLLSYKNFLSFIILNFGFCLNHFFVQFYSFTFGPSIPDRILAKFFHFFLI